MVGTYLIQTETPDFKLASLKWACTDHCQMRVLEDMDIPADNDMMGAGWDILPNGNRVYWGLYSGWLDEDGERGYLHCSFCGMRIGRGL